VTSPALDDRSEKLGSQVLQRLEAMILQDGWIKGRRLGAEEELARRFGVSRAIMREGAAMAEFDGLVESRRGGAGGLFVASSGRWVAASTVRHYLVFSGASSSEVNHFRALVEALACQRAMRRLDMRGARRLREIMGVYPDNLRDRVRSRRLAQAEIHRISGLPMLSLFDTALSECSVDQLLWNGFSQQDYEPLIAKVWKIGADQIEAIIAGDLAGALGAQHRLLRAYEDEHRRAAQARIARDRTSAGDGPLALAFSRDELKAMKKPEALTRTIARRIVETAAAPGDRLGSEQDLMRDLDVSRGVLREALHGLERHGIVALERGFGGGVHVGDPRPDEAVRAAGFYLPPAAPEGRADLMRIAMSLEMLSAEFAADRARAGDAALLNRLERAQAASDGGDAGPGPPCSQGGLLAGLTGSRVLDCLLRILVRHASPAAQDAAAAPAALRAGLLAAIAGGDAPLARRHVAECWRGWQSAGSRDED